LLLGRSEAETVKPAAADALGMPVEAICGVQPALVVELTQ
jgi:hypothetical protein